MFDFFEVLEVSGFGRQDVRQHTPLRTKDLSSEQGWC
jgi:hypothetical protein